MLRKDNSSPQNKIDKFYRDEYEDMLSFARVILRGNVGLAEVAVQETFVFALDKPHKLIGRPDETASLYSILKNITRHILRDQELIKKHFTPIENVSETALQTHDVINIDLRVLKDDPKMSLLKRLYIDGYSISEIAAQENIEIGACKMRIKRAKEEFREKLK